MHLGKRIGAILLMAGEGQRFGSSVPKQFLELNHKKVYAHALDTMEAVGLFDEILLVCHPDWMDLPHSNLICGGKTRQESSFLGLKGFKVKPDIVLIHDAARPFVSERILRENVEMAIHFGAVDTCIASADTLVHAPNGKEIAQIPNRKEYLRGQTPQTFRYDWIYEAHEKAGQDGIDNVSDDCQLVLRMDKKIHIVLGEEKNMKITSELDLFIAEQISSFAMIRSFIKEKS